MHIGFDATVVHGRKSGVGYYCQELLRSLVSLERDDRYFVFSHRPLSRSLVEPSSRIEFATSGFCSVRAIYLHALLPGILRRADPDIVHYTNFLAPMVERHPYVITVHDMSMERFRRYQPIGKRIYTRRLVPSMARRARLILTNSEFSKWDIVRFLGIEEDRIRVTPLAASTVFRPLSPTEVRSVLASYGLERPYFLYVGNIEPRKNLERLLEAFHAIPNHDHQLVLTGNPWFRAKHVRRKAAELGLGDRLRFLDYVPRHDLPAIIGGATAFVYPSLLEGFGLPVLEAMACGRPVITSQTTALAEVAGDSALLIDPRRTDSITDALVAVSNDSTLSEELSEKSLRRAAEFSWKATAEQTRQAYVEALDGGYGRPVKALPANRASSTELIGAVRRTLVYASRFDYPLTVSELQERLIGCPASVDEVDTAVSHSGFRRRDGWVAVDPSQPVRRREREDWSDQVIADFTPELQMLASLPYVRMLAFSGSTAHRNMTDRDIDLFAVVEDGKLWSVLLVSSIWAKLKGIRTNICLNYIVSDRALPLFDTDLFTAQQVASLKPFFGKQVYDRFVRVNPFVGRLLPNFTPSIHRGAYAEFPESRLKLLSERVLSLGPAQLVEWVSRRVLFPYLKRKSLRSGADLTHDVLLERSRIKLHLNSHRQELLNEIETNDKVLSAKAVSGRFAPSPDECSQQDVQVQRY